MSDLTLHLVRHGESLANAADRSGRHRPADWDGLSERGWEQARELGVERDHEHVVLARGDDVPVDLGEHLDGLAVLVDPGRADEHRADRRSVDAGDLEVGLERADLAPERVAPAGVVGEPEVLAVEHDHPRAGAQHGRA